MHASLSRTAQVIGMRYRATLREMREYVQLWSAGKGRS